MVHDHQQLTTERIQEFNQNTAMRQKNILMNTSQSAAHLQEECIM